MGKFFSLPGAPESLSDSFQGFEKNSIFNTHELGKYSTTNIDFVKLAELIKAEQDIDFDYTNYIGERAISSTINGKKKVLNLKGKLNKGKGEIALNLNTNPNGVGGLEFALVLDFPLVVYSFYIYYKDKERVLFSEDDGTHIAIAIQTTDFTDFELLGKEIGKLLLTDRFKTVIQTQFAQAFETAIADYSQMSALYQVAPNFIIQEREDNQLYTDFQTILEGMSSYFKNAYGIDENKAVLNILKGITPSFLYERFREDQTILFTILDKLDSAYDLPFVELIANLCLENWTEEDMGNAASILVGPVDRRSSFYITKFKPAIDISGKILQEGRVNFQNVRGGNNRVGFEGTTWARGHHLEPLAPLLVRKTNGKSFWIPAIVLEPSIQKTARSAEIKFYTDIVFVLANASALKVLQSAAYPIFLKVIAAIELAKAPIDLAMELKGLKLTLAKTEAGRWFVEHWAMISLSLDITTLSAELLYNLVKNGPELIEFFRKNRKKEAAESLEEVVVEVKKYLTEVELKKLREVSFKEAYREGYKYYEVRFLSKDEIRKLFGKAGVKLEYQVSKRMQAYIDEARNLFPKVKKISLTKKAQNWLVQKQLVAGVVYKKYPDLIVLKTNYPKNLLTKFLKKNKISRTKPSIENIKKVYAFFKEQGFIKYDMHNLLKERIIWHIEGLKEGVKHSKKYEWERTGGIPGTHAEVLAINDLLWELEKIKDFKTSGILFEDLLGYNLNMKYQSPMIRCGDCQLLTHDVSFLEKVIKMND